MGTISKPNTFSANTTISSSQVNANFTTIYNEFNGAIAAANLASNAVTTAKIADDNVTAAKIADGAIDAAAKISDGAVTSVKLAEAFVRSRYQSNTTNSAPTGLTMQHGWGFMLGDADDTATEVVTFPVAFTTLYSIQCTALGAKASADPSGITDFTSANNNVANASSPSITGFTAVITDPDGTAIATSTRVGYSWIAMGVV